MDEARGDADGPCAVNLVQGGGVGDQVGARTVQAAHFWARVRAERVECRSTRRRGVAFGGRVARLVIACLRLLLFRRLPCRRLRAGLVEIVVHVGRLGGVEHLVVLLGRGRRAQVGRRVEDGLRAVRQHAICAGEATAGDATTSASDERASDEGAPGG